MKFSTWLYFGKRAKCPLSYNIIQHLGEIIDGLTGLVMIPFGRYGTGIGYTISVEKLRWQRKNRDKNEKF